ncbi:MAG: hypothetical protein JKY67_14585 [Pseudomonadales bacterium]|nr:hypothetical protein [Pseudomonadales bacterium]
MTSQQKTTTDAWLDRGVGLVCLGLVLVISYSLANMTWFIFEGAVEPKIGAVEPMMMESGSQAVSNISLAAIRRWHLFGEIGKQAPETVTKVNKEVRAPVTRLPLILNGVFRARVEVRSSAIVSEKGKTGKLYKVGDKLPGNVTLETVYGNRIILNQNGRLETLHFPKTTSSGLARTSSKRATKKKSRKSRRAAKNSSRREIIKNPKSRLGKLVNQGRLPSPGELVSSINADVQSDVGVALRELGVEVIPMADGGGYKVGAAAPMAMLKTVGLKPNDKVLSVNGQMLGDIERDRYMFEELATNCEGDVSVEIERGPRRFTVNVPCM